MSYKGNSHKTPDLFEVTLTIPTPPSEAVPSPSRPSEPAGLSDAQLALRLGQIVDEVRGRLKAGKGPRPELIAAARQARSSLNGVLREPQKQDRGRRSSKPLPALQEGHRKAVLAALLAGVSPGQVAKHFGLSLAAVRKVLDEAE